MLHTLRQRSERLDSTAKICVFHIYGNMKRISALLMCSCDVETSSTYFNIRIYFEHLL